MKRVTSNEPKLQKMRDPCCKGTQMKDELKKQTCNLALAGTNEQEKLAIKLIKMVKI